MSISCSTKKLHKHPVVFCSSDEDLSSEKSSPCLKDDVVCSLFVTPKHGTMKKDIVSEESMGEEICEPVTSNKECYAEANGKFDLPEAEISDDLQHNSGDFAIHMNIYTNSKNLKCLKLSTTEACSIISKPSLSNPALTTLLSETDVFTNEVEVILSSKSDCSSNTITTGGNIKPYHADKKNPDGIQSNFSDMVTPKHSKLFRSCASTSRTVPLLTWSSDEDDDIFVYKNFILDPICSTGPKKPPCSYPEKVLARHPKKTFTQPRKENRSAEPEYSRCNKQDDYLKTVSVNEITSLKTPAHSNTTTNAYRCVSSSKKISVLILSSDEDEVSPCHEGKKNLRSSSLVENGYTTSFLKSLSPSVNESDADPEGLKYRRNFLSLKFKLAEKLYSLYNEKIFGNELPNDMKLEWSDRLLKTAGYCYCRRVGAERTAVIHLSNKVLDSPDRLRDTLAHELCHAAVFLISKVSCRHGPIWKLYANRCSMAFPELRVPQTCHNYEIHCKYNYHCQKCAKVIGRHSNSLDISRYRCRCGGNLKLIRNSLK